ncbi:hypothetical protein AB0C00_15775, partial [Micromonospora carbonacea]
ATPPDDPNSGRMPVSDTILEMRTITKTFPGVALLGAGLALAATVALSPVFHPWYATWPLTLLAISVVRLARTTWFVLPSAVAAVLTLPDGTNLARSTKAPGAIAMTALVGALLAWAARAGRASSRAKADTRCGP